MSRLHCSRLPLIMLLLVAAIALTPGCKNKKDKVILPPAPAWSIWDTQPPWERLQHLDNIGDETSGFGDAADLVMLEAAYDSDFIYVRATTWDANGCDKTGQIRYSIYLDWDNDGELNSKDYVVHYDGTTGWTVTRADDSPGSPQLMHYQHDENGDVEIAFWRWVPGQPTFGLGIAVRSSHWEAGDWATADLNPDTGFAILEINR